MKAVIKVGANQHLVSKGDELIVDLQDSKNKTLNFEALLIIDDKGKALVGKPTVAGSSVKAKILDETKGKKIKVIKFKAKKRQKTLTGHRQKHSLIKITDIKA